MQTNKMLETPVTFFIMISLNFERSKLIFVIPLINFFTIFYTMFLSQWGKKYRQLSSILVVYELELAIQCDLYV